MRLRIGAAAAVAAGALVATAAVAATPGTYEGWLYKANGKRWPGTQTRLTVKATGDRFELSSYNMRLTCPYLDRNGNPVLAKFRFIHRGIVSGEFIDDTRQYPRRNPTHEVRIRGQFVGRRFAGRVVVRSAPGVTGACTGSARVRVSR